MRAGVCRPAVERLDGDVDFEKVAQAQAFGVARKRAAVGCDGDDGGRVGRPWFAAVDGRFAIEAVQRGDDVKQSHGWS